MHANPITYEISGTLELGASGSQVPSSFVSAIDPGVFGTWTGFLTYDADTAVFDQDIIWAATGEVAGKFYSGGVTAIDVTLNNGIVLQKNSGSVTVFSGDVSALPTGYAVESAFAVPDAFWLSGSPPPDFASFASSVGFLVAGVDPAQNVLGLPPLTLDGATRAGLTGTARLCGNFDGNGFISINTECVTLTSSTDGSVTRVPEPGIASLLAFGLVTLGWARRRELH